MATKITNKKPSNNNGYAEKINLPKKKNYIRTVNTNVYEKISSFRSNKTVIYDEPEEYKGLVDINCLSIYNARETMNRLQNKLKNKNIFFVQTSPYVLRCSKNKTSFDIEICEIEEGIYYHLIKMKSGGINANLEIIHQLFN